MLERELAAGIDNVFNSETRYFLFETTGSVVRKLLTRLMLTMMFYIFR
jgi:hypothetical protein